MAEFTVQYSVSKSRPEKDPGLNFDFGESNNINFILGKMQCTVHMKLSLIESICELNRERGGGGF